VSEEKKRLDARDYKKIEGYIKEEHHRRKVTEWRQKAEQRWKTVDRQIAMEEMIAIDRDTGLPDSDWRSVFELGELARASEAISADIRRITFPQARFWFETHAEIKPDLNEDGTTEKDPDLQEQVDGRLRAFMTQQHTDFGLKDRVDLSVKEALHHGSFVAECEWDTMEMIFEGTKVKTVGSPVWKPHSMWNCWPDQSPSIIGTNMFYAGSMIIESYMPRYKAQEMVESGGEGFFSKQWPKVNKEEHRVKEGVVIKDVKITTYYGDMSIERSEENLLYLNHKILLMNGTLVYMKANTLPFSPIIYKGYEKQDVRDPYFTSPIIKMSPIQTMATTLANKYVDGISLYIEPPLVYDANDPQFALDGGPRIEPGAKVGSKSGAQFKLIEVGDPQQALQGLQMAIGHMKESLGRTGQPIGDRATAAEVDKRSQDEEVTMVGFIDKLELALRSYLYMQHEINKSECENYSFYDPEMNQPDFVRIKKDDIPKQAHFEVVGARGVLGEQQRQQKLTQVVAFASGHPIYSQLLKPQRNLKQLYQDAGVKNPEQFIKNDDEMQNPEVQALKQQAQHIIQELTQKLQEAEKAANDKIAGLQQKMQQHQEKTQVLTQSAQLEHAEKMQQMALDYNAKMADIQAKLQVNADKITAELTSQRNQMLHEIGQLLHNNRREDQAQKAQTTQMNPDISKMLEKLDELSSILEADHVPVRGKDGKVERVKKEPKAKVTH
jgi:hypothetical protein